MYVIVWEFQVAEARAKDFEREYEALEASATDRKQAIQAKIEALDA